MNLARRNEEKELREGERVSVICEDRQITNMGMLHRSRRLASALGILGLAKGDRVIVQMPNCPEVPRSPKRR